MKRTPVRRREEKCHKHSPRQGGADPLPRTGPGRTPTPAAGAASGRCDAHRSPTAPPAPAGRRSPLPAAAVSLFFEAVLLLGVGQGVARPRHLLSVLQPLQVVPAALEDRKSTRLNSSHT